MSDPPDNSTAPGPNRPPISSEAASLRVAPVLNVNAIALDNADPPATVRMPAPTVDAPVNVFTPESLSSEAPPLVRPKLPEITPLKVAALTTFRVEVLRSPAFPLRVSTPAFTESPKVTEPESRRALVTPIAEPEALEMRPPNRLSVPTPKA